MQLLNAVRAAGISGAPMKYEWDLDVSREITYPLEEEHARLVYAFDMISERAAFALALANAEWVAGRFEGIIDISDALARIEAGYAAELDPRYVNLPEPAEPFPKKLQDAHGPLKLARMLISSSFGYYSRGEAAVNSEAMSMALLARHVCPKRKRFDAWLSGALRKLHVYFPDAQAPLSAQAPVPQVFFELDSDWDPVTVPQHLEAFLAGLDPTKNPYLVDAQQLKALGFRGTPYHL